MNLPQAIVELDDGRIDTRHPVLFTDDFCVLPVNVTNTICLGPGDPSCMDPKHRVSRRDDFTHGCTREPRDQVGATLVGLAAKVVHVCRSCPCNADNALMHRHGAVQPPVTGDFSWFLSKLDELQDVIAHYYVEYLSEWKDRWLEKWPLSKQAAIRRSREDDPVRADRVNCMVKREVLVRCDDALPTKARDIQYYTNLATQAAYGPEFFSMQKALVATFLRRDLGDGIFATFASGMDGLALSEWMTEVCSVYAQPRFYERDGKNWDATMQSEHLDVKLAAYKPAGPEFCAFVRNGFRVQGRQPRHVLKYVLHGTTKSGHNDTTSGNSVVNIAVAATALRRLGLRGDIIAAGDDLLIVVDGDFDASALARCEAELGIKPEYRKFEDVRDVSFISGIWLGVAGGLWFMPKPGRLVAKLFWTVKPPPAKLRARFLNSVVLGLQPVCGALPVVGTFLSAHRDVLHGTADWLVGKRFKSWTNGYGFDRADLIEAFCHRYCVSEDDVVDCENLIASVGGATGLLRHVVLDRMMCVDLGDIGARPLSL